MNARLFLLPLLFLSTLAGAASPKATAPSPSQEAQEQKPTPRNNRLRRHIQIHNLTDKPITEPDQELFEFALLLEHRIRGGDAEYVQAHLDAEAFVRRVMEGLRTTPRHYEELITETSAATRRLGRRLVVDHPERNGPLDSTRLVQASFEKNGTVRLLYRIRPGEGLNYVEFEVRRTERNQFVIVDATDFRQGDSFARSLRHLFQLTAPRPSREGEVPVIEGKPQLVRFLTLLQSGQYAQALEAYDALPDRIRGDKEFLLKRLSAARHLGKDTWLRALADLERVHPEAHVLELLVLEKHQLEDNAEGELKALERLQRRVQDAYLNHLRGMAQLRLERFTEARRSFEAAIDVEPTLLEPHMELLTLDVEAKDYAQAVRTLENMERSTGSTVRGIQTAPELADFLQSPEYQAFQKRAALP